jgi:drug/metabolite transporter (DMT)-like permease
MWIIYAISASVFWGMNYTVTEQVLKRISMPAVYIASALALLLFGITAGLAAKTLPQDWDVLKKGGDDTKLFLISALIFVIADVFILLSIKAKNATMAGMIEITYPLFTAFFAWIFFRQAQMNWSTLLGGLLIISGVACIYFFDKSN